MRSLLCLLLISPTLLAQDIPLTPQESLKRITVPDGFRARLYAAEPDVLNPIAMTFDDLGRLWVVESHSYPHWIKDGKPGKDRILIFEGRKDDGSFERCHVFMNNGTNLSGIAVGHSGVWLLSLPKLIFIPCKAGANAPEGPPQVLLGDFSLEVKHNAANNLHWGPDGWLYGCHGITDTSTLGVPGAAPEKRFRINCGVWRYHPTRKVAEPYAWGTTNPWGLDWDDFGEMFITNCVIKHAFHVIPGAHFVRMYGNDLNPHVFDLIESCADHVHWAGGHWTSSRGAVGAHDEAGGGHAHVGAMVYLSDTWPKEYRGHLFMGNLHGSRLNMDILERKGSGYVSKRGFDPFKANDPWFRPISVLQAPDGNVVVSDWHDTGECHNYDKTYPSGRIYRMEYVKGTKPLEKFNIGALTDEELVKLQTHENDWFVRRARLQLQERGANGTLKRSTVRSIGEGLQKAGSVRAKLRYLWALNAATGGDQDSLEVYAMDGDALGKEDPAFRVWLVRLALEREDVSRYPLGALRRLANDRSPAVRLAVACALQRLPIEHRFVVAEILVRQKEDWNDPNIPLLIWYGIEPLVAAHPDEAMDLLAACEIGRLRTYIARRLTLKGESSPDFARVLDFLGKSSKDQVTKDILGGIHEAFNGRRDVKMPGAWKALQAKLMASKDDEVSERSALLGVIGGDKDALVALKRQAADRGLRPEKRKRALQALVQIKGVDVALLSELLTDEALREQALQALATVKDADIPGIVLKRYAVFAPSEKQAAIATLSSRADYALALLDAVEKKRVPRADISALAARQISSLKDKTVSARLAEVWGTIRPTAGMKRELLTKYLAMAAPDAVKKADRKLGQHLFTKHCASCHKLFGEGGAIGPELTGSQRTNPEYLLTKLLDPSAAVNKDYQMSILMLEDGRTLSGIVKEETDKTLAVQTPTELVRLSKADVQSRKVTGQSIMPEGLLQTLTDAEVRALLAYLGGDGR